MDTQPNEPAESPPASDKRKQTGCMGLSWPATIALAVVAVFVIAMCMPNIQVVSYSAREAEVKQNIHSIQLAIERYSVDDPAGSYPAYLIGGAGQYSAFSEHSPDKFINVTDCADANALCDPLLREGYLNYYPRNPFVHSGSVSLHNLQVKSEDPLRNSSPEANIHGTRFGPDCTQMGNVMADNRYTEFTIRDEKGIEYTYPTFANVEYPCADMWKGKKPTAFLPGEFFYRTGNREIIDGRDIRGDLCDYYLGAYGGSHTRGEDRLGPDPTGRNEFSPFSSVHINLGNPDGIPDGIIIMLEPADMRFS
jgi:hypothetical protein